MPPWIWVTSTEVSNIEHDRLMVKDMDLEVAALIHLFKKSYMGMFANYNEQSQ